MLKALRLAKREYVASVRTKGFILSLVLAPVLMSGGLIAMALMEDRRDTTDQRVAIVDRSGLVGDAIVAAAKARNETAVHDDDGNKVRPTYIVEIVASDLDDPATLRLQLSERVRRKELHAFVEIGPAVMHAGDDPEGSHIAYHAQNAEMDDLRRWIAWPINQHLRRLRLEEAGVSGEAAEHLFAWIDVDGMGLVRVDPATGTIAEARRSNKGEAVGVPMAMMMLMFVIVMTGAMPLLNSVMEEKTQRIAEVLLGSVRPFSFMMGKVLGGIAVSLTAAAVYVAMAVVGFQRADLAQYIPYDILPWFFAFVALNILMMGSMLAALGSACNDAKDAQTLSLPAMLPVMIPMFVFGQVLRQPSSDLATTLSLIPPFTPMLMLLRQSTPAGVPAWQPWVGLVGVIATSLLAVWIGGRVFRVGILMQGKPPRLPDLMRWAVRG